MPIKRTYASHGDACATSHAMELLGDRWTYPILRELMLAPKRFSELEASLRGITPAVLTTRLRNLEGSGLVRRVTLPAPARVVAYEATGWARELRPVFDSLGRWALRSPVRDIEGCGLTPDAAIQSMLTMAPPVAMDPPLELDLGLVDARVDPESEPYRYRLHWAEELTIERSGGGERGYTGRHSGSEAPAATVTGDSSTWMGVLYQGVDARVMEIAGDAATVDRLVEAFDGVLDEAVGGTEPVSPATGSAPAR